MAISFNINYPSFKLNKSLKLKNWIKHIIATEKKELGKIQYVFVSDDDLLKLNIKYLKHTSYTDIITFNYNEGNKLNGEIFISIDRVAENAAKFKDEFQNELHRVIIHGILHLCGYNDKTKKEAERMRQMENKSLSQMIH